MNVYDELYFDNLSDLKEICWSGAIQRIEEVEELDNDKQQEFVDYVIEMLEDNEHLSTTTLNDFIWFECDDFIEDLKGEEEEEDI